jgi:membrane-bound inhibitor of C-type lysozyme
MKRILLTVLLIAISLVLIVLSQVVLGGLFYYTNVEKGGVVTPIAEANYICNGGKTMSASFYKGKDQPVEPGQMPVPSGSAKLSLSDGRKFDLKQTISADGGRYANSDESFIFWDKGNTALVLENGAEKDYKGCHIK